MRWRSSGESPGAPRDRRRRWADAEAVTEADIEAEMEADLEADMEADLEADMEADLDADMEADTEGGWGAGGGIRSPTTDGPAGRAC